MTNITELKEKLTKYSRNNESCSNHYNNIPWQYVNNMSFENVHSNGYHQGQKDKAEDNAKTITALLSIIEDMQKCAIEVIEDGSKPIGDLGGYFIADENYNNLLVTLTATEQKLKKITEEK